MREAVKVGVASALAGATVVIALLATGTYEPADLLFPGQRGIAAGVVVDDFGEEAVPDRFSYDGQETYVIARTFPDVREARDLGIPEFRIRRILQPAIASLAPDGTPIVAVMVVTNLVGIGLAAGALADLAARHGRDVRVGYGAALTLTFPLLVTTTEGLAFGLGLVGLALLDRDRPLPAAALISGAALTRETALVIAIAGALVLLGRGRRVLAAELLAISAAPVVLWAVWLRSQVPADTYTSSKLLGFLDMPPPSLADVVACALAVGLMVVGAWTWRDVPVVALTALGFLGCCAFYIGDSFQYHGLPRVSAAAMAIGIAGCVPRLRPARPATGARSASSPAPSGPAA